MQRRRYVADCRRGDPRANDMRHLSQLPSIPTLGIVVFYSIQPDSSRPSRDHRRVAHRQAGDVLDRHGLTQGSLLSGTRLPRRGRAGRRGRAKVLRVQGGLA